MRCLLIFDGWFDPAGLSFPERKPGVMDLDLFSLTTDQNDSLMDYLAQKGVLSIREIAGSKLIAREVECIQQWICGWSFDVGEYKIGARTIKEWFLNSGKSVSAWWFSLLSEKNTLKTDAFLKIAQIQAIDRIITSEKYDACWIAIEDRTFRNTVKKLLTRYGIRVRTVSIPSKPLPSRNERIEKRFSESGIVGDLLYAMGLFCRYTLRGIRARRILSAHPLTERQTNGDILFVTYFPSLDKDSAEKGIFVNKYAGSIPKRLCELKKKINWLLMYVPVGGHSYGDGLRFGKRFAENGESIFFLEEFFTPAAALKSLFAWIVQIITFFRIDSVLYRRNYRFNLPVPESASILFPIWRQSFIGNIGMQGIIFFEIYKEIFKTFRHCPWTLYFAEMHAWEKALNAAKNAVAPNVKTIGFQHVIVPKNFFHYFYDPRETLRTGQNTDLPLPDMLAANGKSMYAMLRKSAYPNLILLEAVRQLYLKDLMNSSGSMGSKKTVLLVAGSTDKTETVSLTQWVHAAFHGSVDMEIWFKSHPALPFESIFNELGIEAESNRYIICRGSLENILTESLAVIVPSSTVAIEALAFGCEVIVPLLPNAMLMNPLADFSGFFHPVSCAEDLIETMERIRSGCRLHTLQEYRSFVETYWLLDPELTRWIDLLQGKIE